MVGLQLFLGPPVAAQSSATTAQAGESYVPGIWVDPDGCEHWVMDDGFEGFMSPHLDRQGRPVCHSSVICGVVDADRAFPRGGSSLSTAATRGIEQFFQNRTARAFSVTGHTDRAGGDSANVTLSERQARAVARVGASAGARINEVRGFGARQPKVSNATEAGRARNRRVDILCIY
ncbi:MAG: OmpA family protein [Pseudomonadota bacterium]